MADSTFNPRGYTKAQLTAALADDDRIKLRTAWVFGVVAAGEKSEQTFPLSADIMSKAEGNPVVCISPVLTDVDTYNPGLHYYADSIDNGNTGTLVIGVENGSSEEAAVPDAAIVVL